MYSLDAQIVHKLAVSLYALKHCRLVKIRLVVLSQSARLCEILGYYKVKITIIYVSYRNVLVNLQILKHHAYQAGTKSD